MKRRFATVAVRCLVAVAALVLMIAPAASAKVAIVHVTASEAYAQSPNLAAERITGNIARLTFDNVLSETSASELVNGVNYTHMNVVTPLVGGSWLNSTRGICYGTSTFVTDTMGVWKCTFAGTISMAGGTYDCAVNAKGVSGAVSGMVFLGRTVNTGGFASSATMSGTIIAPHGF
jgi:hypothetical protein